MAVVRSAALRVAFPLAALGLGLIVVEIALRLAGVAYPAWGRPTPGLREWGVPYAEGQFVGETRNWVKLNGMGNRDVDRVLEKGEDVFRVVVVGDSYVAAFEVDLEQTFWSVMEEALSGCAALGSRRVEVIGLAKRGFGTTDELLALRRFGFAYDPDWVVLAFLSGNDFRNNSRALKDSDRPYHVFDDDELVLDDSYARSEEFLRWTGWRGDLWYGLVRHSRLVQVLRHVRRQIKIALELAQKRGEVEGGEVGLDDRIYLEPEDPSWQSAWRVTEGVIAAMRDEVEAEGGALPARDAQQRDPGPSGSRGAHALPGSDRGCGPLLSRSATRPIRRARGDRVPGARPGSPRLGGTERDLCPWLRGALAMPGPLERRWTSRRGRAPGRQAL